jgi:hypothetical protein
MYSTSTRPSTVVSKLAVCFAVVWAPFLEGCSRSGGGGRRTAARFRAGDTIPGYTLKAPTGSRADLPASSRYENGRWTVLFTRGLATAWPDQDIQFSGLASGSTYTFSVAVLDNAGGGFDQTMTGQHCAPFTLGNEGTAADLRARSTAAAPSSDPANPNWGPMLLKPAGSGIPGTATGAAVELRAAYDAANFYLLAIWEDATESTFRESWIFDGSTWTRRLIRGNDGSWATIDADGSQWDEDRLAIWWDINVTNFSTLGCMALCHQMRMGSLTLGERSDLWHWKASRTAPMGFTDDQRLNDGVFEGVPMAGRSDDTGTGIETGNTAGSPALPAFMAEGDPGAGARFLFQLPARSRRAVPFQQ